MKYILQGIIIIMIIDFTGFIAWKTTNQKPLDNFHAGIITETIVKAL